VKGECRSKIKTKFFHFDYAEPHPTLFKDNKDNANRVQYKAFLSEKRKVKSEKSKCGFK